MIFIPVLGEGLLDFFLGKTNVLQDGKPQASLVKG